MGVGYLEKPDVSNLVGSTQGGANQHIHLTMQPTRTSLADAVRTLEDLKNPPGRNFGAIKAHRSVLSPPEGHGLVDIKGPIGLFYANAVGDSDVAPAGRDRGRLDCAGRRLAIAMGEGGEFHCSYVQTKLWSYRKMRSSISHFSSDSTPY